MNHIFLVVHMQTPINYIVLQEVSFMSFKGKESACLRGTKYIFIQVCDIVCFILTLQIAYII